MAATCRLHVLTVPASSGRWLAAAKATLIMGGSRHPGRALALVVDSPVWAHYQKSGQAIARRSVGLEFLNLRSPPIKTRGIYRAVLIPDGEPPVSGPEFVVQQI